jgi:multiple sugar transport system substrate-binding protein
MKKIMLLLAVLVLTSTVVFAGGGGQAPAGASVVRWSFWGGESRIKNTQLAIDIFTQNTGIIVAAEPAPGTGEHFDKFKIQFAGGNAADIIQTGGDFSNFGLNDQVSTCAGIEDILLPLDPYVRSGVLNIKDVDASAIQAGTRNGVLYAVPVAANMPALIYNKALLQRIGAPLPKVSMTWAEFETWLGQVKARMPANQYPMTDNSATQTGSVFFGYWAGQNGTPMWDGKVTKLTAAEVQKYFEMWNRWRSAGWIPPANVSGDFAETNESTSALIAGRTAVAFAWSNALVNYQAATRDELDLIELPNAAASKGLWGQMSQMMAISKKSKNPEAAARFIGYRVTDPGVWKIMGSDPGTPVTPAARAAAGGSAEAAKIAAYLDVAGAHASPRNPNVPSDTEWNSGLFLIAQNVAFGRRTPAQGGQDVMDLINRLIASAPR